ncbi:MAG: TldD/PmbA family protein [Candidatus Heimdallarchaeota archaeon]
MDFCEIAVNKAIKLGMDEADAVVRNEKTIQINFAQEIQNISTLNKTLLSVRVIKDRKIATYSTTLLNKQSIHDIVERAVKIAKVAPEDPNWSSLNKTVKESKVKNLYDPVLDKLDYDDLAGAINTGLDTVANDGKALITRGVLGITKRQFSFANCYQDSMERKSSRLNTYILAKAVKGGESTGSEHIQTRFWKDIDYTSLTNSAVEMSQKYLDAKPIESRKISVIIKNDVFARIMNRMLSPSISAETVRKGRSPLKDKIDSQIAMECFSLFDDGTLEKGLNSSSFDQEGHPTQRTPIISNGILKNYIYDHYSATIDKTQSTGNANRGGRAKPRPNVSNLVLVNGDRDFDEVISETKNGLFIEKTIGEWLSNPTSGQLNATVTHGQLIENGEYSQPVKNVILSGNFWEAIKNNIEAICNDSRNSGNIYSPSVKFSELVVAGK